MQGELRRLMWRMMGGGDTGLIDYVEVYGGVDGVMWGGLGGDGQADGENDGELMGSNEETNSGPRAELRKIGGAGGWGSAGRLMGWGLMGGLKRFWSESEIWSLPVLVFFFFFLELGLLCF